MQERFLSSAELVGFDLDPHRYRTDMEKNLQASKQ
jgi:hypothetical protein